MKQQKRASRAGAEPETTGPVPVDRHHGHAHGTKYGTRYTFGIVKSASNKIEKLAACCKFRSFEYRDYEKDVLMTDTWPQHKIKNDDSTTVGVGRTDLVPEAEVRTATGVLVVVD